MKLVLLLVLCGGFCSCAAILGGGNIVPVNVNSNPEGASVYANGAPAGSTPTTIQADKRKDLILEFRKEGFESRTAMIASSAQAGWIVADVFLTGLVGVAIDAATGAWKNLDQEHIQVVMEKK